MPPVDRSAAERQAARARGRPLFGCATRQCRAAQVVARSCCARFRSFCAQELRAATARKVKTSAIAFALCAQTTYKLT
eukprot:4868957-Prymnesium_polylepis.1